MRCFRILVLCLAIAAPLSAEAAIEEIPGFENEVSGAEQQMSEWCWAASIQAVLEHYGIHRSQQDIVVATYGQLVNLPALGPQALYRTLNNLTFNDGAIEVTRGVFSGGAPPPSLLLAEIQAGHPVIAWYANPGGQGGHSVVIHAVNYFPGPMGPTVTHIGYFDPWPGRGIQVEAAASLASRMSGFWIIRGARALTHRGRPGVSTGSPGPSSEPREPALPASVASSNRISQVCQNQGIKQDVVRRVLGAAPTSFKDITVPGGSGGIRETTERVSTRMYCNVHILSNRTNYECALYETSDEAAKSSWRDVKQCLTALVPGNGWSPENDTEGYRIGELPEDEFISTQISGPAVLKAGFSGSTVYILVRGPTLPEKKTVAPDDTTDDSAGCHKDSDCKGNRICVNRSCTDPPPK